jgi:hypothetical protein
LLIKTRRNVVEEMDFILSGSWTATRLHVLHYYFELDESVEDQLVKIGTIFAKINFIWPCAIYCVALPEYFG